MRGVQRRGRVVLVVLAGGGGVRGGAGRAAVQRVPRLRHARRWRARGV